METWKLMNSNSCSQCGTQISENDISCVVCSNKVIQSNKYHLRNVVLATLVFGIFFGLARSDVFQGLAGGLLFGLAMGLFLIKKKASISVQGDFVFTGAANYFVDREAVGGQLYLTDKDLIFKSHAFNIQEQNLTIPRSTITNVEKYNSLLIIPNGLKVTTDKKVYKFVVNGRRTWIDKLGY